jgi:DNA-binding transcriptional regulator YdaS (Cro superfamily)
VVGSRCFPRPSWPGKQVIASLADDMAEVLVNLIVVQQEFVNLIGVQQEFVNLIGVQQEFVNLIGVQQEFVNLIGVQQEFVNLIGVQHCLCIYVVQVQTFRRLFGSCKYLDAALLMHSRAAQP